MKLKKLKINNFKSIDNTEEFEIGDVTCLVGKNESGKTAILSSLYKLNPIEADKNKFDTLEEYPRGSLTEYEEKVNAKKISPANVLTAFWELEENEIKAIEKIYGAGVLETNTVIIQKGYDNIQYWTIEFNEKKIIDNFLDEFKLDKRKYKDIYDIDDVNDFITIVKQISEPDETIKNLIAKLDEKIPTGRVSRKPMDILNGFLPKFLYFSDYYRMSGQVSLDEFKKKKGQNSLEVKDKVFESLLDLAGTSSDEIDTIDKFDRLQAKLQAVSIRLSKEIFNYWSQNKNLQVQFRYDAARPGDPPPFNAGYVFRTYIYNTTHQVSINFDERSAGFVWFFSFLVWFSQIRKNYGDNLIILLDEPGLNLHAKAQNDLLRYFSEKLKPTFQVIYTTHSPFMVDPQNLLNVKTVEDIVKDDQLLGTKVRDDIYSVDKETLFPLQAAMGYDITQSLFIGKNSLLVEGPSDLIYINWFSNLLREQGRVYLTPKWTITPVGGLDKIGSFIALFGANNLNIAVLTDFHKGEKNKIRSLKESALLKTGQFLSAEMFSGTDEADIEDILGRDMYIELVNSCYDLKGKNRINTVKPIGSPTRVLEDVENHFRTLPPSVPEFSHFTPALYLLDNSDSLKKTLPGLDIALEKFENIFKTLNSFLEK